MYFFANIFLCQRSVFLNSRNCTIFTVKFQFIAQFKNTNAPCRGGIYPSPTVGYTGQSDKVEFGYRNGVALINLRQPHLLFHIFLTIRIFPQNPLSYQLRIKTGIDVHIKQRITVQCPRQKHKRKQKAHNQKAYYMKKRHW